MCCVVCLCVVERHPTEPENHTVLCPSVLCTCNLLKPLKPLKPLKIGDYELRLRSCLLLDVRLICKMMEPIPSVLVLDGESRQHQQFGVSPQEWMQLQARAKKQDTVMAIKVFAFVCLRLRLCVCVCVCVNTGGTPHPKTPANKLLNS